jgi:hypothetical protein
MKTTVYNSSSSILLRSLLALAILVLGLATRSVSAAPATIVGGTLPGNTIWTQGGTYQVDSSLIVPIGVTLTIEAGVVVENYYGPTESLRYNFDVEGTLIANGTAAQPIHFNPGPEGWSGITITGQPGAINTGSSLSYVIAESGGFTGSGTAANLLLQYAVVDVHHCQFNHSPGDGILGDDSGGLGVANIYDSSFTGNAGFAVNFEDGSVNPVLANLTATGNGALLPYGGNLVNINDNTLHGAHIWENMGLPYLILQTIVGPDSVLTIEPGVQVLANAGNDGLDVEGRLVANGTASQEIRFDPADPASGWSGIAIIGTDTQPSTGSLLNYVTVSKGGFTGGTCDLYVTYGDVTVINSQFATSEDSGVCLDHGATLVMSNTQLIDNQQYAINVIDAGAQFTLDNLTATGNMSNTIGVEGGIMTGDHTWPRAGINTYDLHYNAVTVAPTGTLNIEPGVTILFGEARDITVRGNLTALGTPSDPILFSGETQTPGFWTDLNFEGTPEQPAVGQFAYTTIEYGGYGGSAMVNINNADVTFGHCTLRYSLHDAIYVYPDQVLAPLLANLLAIQPLEIYWSNLLDIGGYAINNGSAQAVLAKYNWWGAASGPTADGNPGGTGSGLNGAVLFRPYLTAPDQTTVYLPLVRR